MSENATDPKTQLIDNLNELHLPAMRSGFEEVAQRAQQESLSYERYLLELTERECQARRANRIERMSRESRLPPEKSLQSLDLKRLPVLADALEEAGCTDEQVLGRLRGPGTHVRGCFVVDLLLGGE